MSAARGKGVLARRAGTTAVLAVVAAMPTMAGTAQATSARATTARATTAQTAGVASEVICSGYASCSSRGHSDHGYPGHSRSSYWRMTAGNECTNYVAYVEAKAFHARQPRYLLGNAGQWARTAAAHGVVVNHTPAVGAVAEWDGGAPGMGPEGHVAVVEKVGRHRRYIFISQQHIGSDRNGYDWTRINAGYPSSAWQEWPSHFLHFRQRHHHRHHR